MIENYIENKLNVLKELRIPITHEEINHIKELKSEIAIDNYCKPLILNGYEEYGY